MSPMGMTRRELIKLAPATGLAALAGAPPGAAAIERQALRFARDDPVAGALRTRLPRVAERSGFGGAILVAAHGRPVVSGAFGPASIAYGVPNTTGTLFNLASAGKMFTAVAAAQLLERGKLSLGWTVGQLLPTYPNQEVRETVTVRQLLTHTGGLGDIFTNKFATLAKNRFTRVTDFFELFAQDPPLFRPGTQFSYSNAGYMVLGAIIEAAAGISYFDYIRQHVFKPAGMRRAGFYELDREIPHRATALTTESPATGTPGIPKPGQQPAGTSHVTPRNAIYENLYKGMPAGGSYATVGDMLAFSRALLGHRLLRPTTTNLVTTGTVDAFPGERYGYGFEDGRHNGTRIVGHGGSAPGAFTRLEMFLEKDYVAVTLGNRDGGLPVVLEMRRAIARA